MYRYAVLLWFSVFASAAYQLDLKYAWNGFSPMDWVTQYTQVSSVSGAFPNGVLGYQYSAPMYLYPWAEIGLGIPAEHFVYLFVAFEIAAMMLAMYYLQRQLRPNSGRWVVVLVLVFSTTSWLRDVNLARYGQPAFLGLYYTFADVFLIAAVVMILRGRYLFTALMLGGAFVTHPPLGLIGAAVCAAIAISDRNTLRPKPALFALAAFGAIAALWMSLFRNVGMSGGEIPHDMWLSLTQAVGVHWYPVQYGMFGPYYNERFFGFVSLLLLAVFYIPLDATGKRILAGIATALAISIFGVLVSWLFPTPFLVKLSLNRASDLVVLLSLPYIAAGLVSDLRSGPQWKRVLAAGMLFAPFSHHRGMPLLLTLPLLHRMRNCPVGGGRSYQRLRAGAWWGGVTLLLGYSVAYYDQSWESKDLIRWGGLLALLAIAAFYGHLTKWDITAFSKGAGVTVCVLCAGWLAYTGLRLRNTDEVQAYKDVQLWARNNTSADALFMSDPTTVGWRDYSRRASFGSVYEWLYSGWLYDSKEATFDEGLARYGELTSDIRRGLGFPRPLDGRAVLLQQAFKGYYGASDTRRRELAHKYGITYFVFKKEYLISPVHLPIRYENRHFLVVAAD